MIYPITYNTLKNTLNDYLTRIAIGLCPYVTISVQNKYNCTNKYRCRVSKTIELRLKGRNLSKHYRHNISSLKHSYCYHFCYG